MSSIIELKDLKKAYKVGDKSLEVLKGINFTIDKGDFLMIMGKSGSGKTTLLNILGMLDSFDSGKYLFNGTDIGELSENECSKFRNKNIGFIFQQFNLIESLNICQNVELPLLYGGKTSKSERREKVKEYLRIIGLEEKIDQKPTALSGGQQQRIAIARALINEPNIILADEPTGALDSQTGIDIMNVLKSLNNEGKTIIMVTHDDELKSYANKVIYVRDGEVVRGD